MVDSSERPGVRIRVEDAHGVLVAVVGATLLWAGYSKLNDVGGFHAAIRAQDLLPSFAHGAVAWCTPLVEIVLGSAAVLAALSRHRINAAGLAMAVLFGAFAVYGIGMIGWSPNASAGCGCGIVRAERANWATIAALDAGVSTALASLAAVARRVPTAIPPADAPLGRPVDH